MSKETVFFALALTWFAGPAFGARSALVLYDDVKVESNPFGSPSKVIEKHRSGDVVEVNDEKVKPIPGAKSKRYYQVKTASGTGWIDAANIFELDSEEIFQSYVQGTSTMELVLESAPHDKRTDQAKVNIIDSESFLVRVLENPNVSVQMKSAAIVKLTGMARPTELVAIWLKHLPDDVGLDSSVPPSESLLRNSYATLSQKEQESLFHRGCEVLGARGYLDWLVTSSIGERNSGPARAALDCFEKDLSRRQRVAKSLKPIYQGPVARISDPAFKKEVSERLRKLKVLD